MVAHASAISQISYRAAAVPIVFSLLSGTVSSISNKVLYGTNVDGDCPDQPHEFKKAFFFTLLMFLGFFFLI